MVLYYAELQYLYDNWNFEQSHLRMKKCFWKAWEPKSSPVFLTNKHQKAKTLI